MVGGVFFLIEYRSPNKMYYPTGEYEITDIEVCV